MPPHWMQQFSKFFILTGTMYVPTEAVMLNLLVMALIAAGTSTYPLPEHVLHSTSSTMQHQVSLGSLPSSFLSFAESKLPLLMLQLHICNLPTLLHHLNMNQVDRSNYLTSHHADLFFKVQPWHSCKKCKQT